MSSIRDFATRSMALARVFQAKREGVAAVEFAFIVPIMMFVFIGVVELSYAMTVFGRVQQVANSTADLVARAENQITQTDLSDLMKAGSYILAPFSQNPESITLRQIMSSPTSATNTVQAWSCTYTGSNQSLACACTNTPYTLPPNLMNTNDSVVVGQATYDYKPIVFNYFLKVSLASLSDGAGGYRLFGAAYLKPRGTTAMLLQTNGTPCPAPTFGG